MSKITVSNLAFDSNSFINEVAETESSSVNGGSEALTFAAGFLPITDMLLDSLVRGMAILTIADLAKSRKSFIH